jgi:predicted alpha/beta-hydrolase family hydrolase
MKVFLAPGATGGVSSLRPYLDGLAGRAIDAHPIQLPGGNAERAAPIYLEQSGEGLDVVVGGRSYGGRVASLVAADPEHDFAGLLLFAYPLHRPGFPEQLRTEHWPRIRCPVLIVQGESDPFGSPAELHREARKLHNVRVVTLAGTGHTLKGKLDETLAAAADWIRTLG